MAIFSYIEAFLAARPGQADALYFTEGGSVRLDLRNCPGKYDLRWIDITTGQWAQQSSLKGMKCRVAE